MSVIAGPTLEAIFNSIKKYWKYYVAGFFVVLSGINGEGWHHDHAQLIKEKAAHQKDINDFKIAQAQANANAIAEANKLKQDSKEKADEADKNYTALLNQYHASVLRYQDNQRKASTSSNSKFQPTKSSNGPGESTVVPEGTINITLDDAQICAENTARIQSVHDWATELNKEK